MDQLHEQKFIFLLTNVLSNVMQACHRSCASQTTMTWLLAHPNTISFRLSFAHFFITFCLRLSIPHPRVPYLSRCQCGHTINDLGIHLLCCPCGREHTVTRDMLQNTIAAITLEKGIHIQIEVSHLFPHHTQR
jgi:hypothetical protein